MTTLDQFGPERADAFAADGSMAASQPSHAATTPSRDGPVGETLESSRRVTASSSTWAAPSPPPPATRRPVPKITGYEIFDELGRGGMGVVYRALHVPLNRPCALKMILSGNLAGADAIQRIQIEAETVARFRHPHIVQI